MPEINPYAGTETRQIDQDTLDTSRRKFEDETFRDPALDFIRDNDGQFSVFCSRQSILDLLPEFDPSGKVSKDDIVGIRFQIGEVKNGGQMTLTARSANSINRAVTGYKDENFISGISEMINEEVIKTENSKFDYTNLSDGVIRTGSFTADQLLNLLYKSIGNFDAINIHIDTVIAKPSQVISVSEFLHLALYRTNEELVELPPPCPPDCY